MTTTFRNTIGLFVTIFVLCQSTGHTFFDTFMYPCSSAMVCVDIAKCNKVGVISTNDVILTAEEELFRTPLLPCRKSDGDQGVCCRDPDYKDDWPTDVSNYDAKGQYKPDSKGQYTPEVKPVAAKVLGDATKVKETKECLFPNEILPNGQCGRPERVIKGEAFLSESISPITKTPTIQYLPPVTESPRPVGKFENPIVVPNVPSSVSVPSKPQITPNVPKNVPNAPVSVKSEATIQQNPNQIQYLPPKEPISVPKTPSSALKETFNTPVVASVKTPSVPSASIQLIQPSVNVPSTVKVENPVIPAIENSKKYLPPSPSAPQLKNSAECLPGETRQSNGECAIVIPKPADTLCPLGTNKTEFGCQAIIQIKTPPNAIKHDLRVSVPTTPKPIAAVTPTLPYNPDRTYLPPATKKPSEGVKSVVESIATMMNIPHGSCSRGKIIEQNNKRYCCEEL